MRASHSNLLIEDTLPEEYRDWLIQTGDGRYSIKDELGNSGTLLLAKILPDGTNLLDTVNNHLKLTILQVLIALRTSSEESINSAYALVAIGNSLIILIQWMVLHRIYHFHHLDSSSINKYLSDAGKGIDVCINATPRMLEFIKKCASSLDKEHFRELSSSKIFFLAGIPPEYMPRLPTCLALLKEFKATGNVPSGKMKSQSRQVTKNYYQQICNSLELLWSKRAELSYPLPENPFPHGSWYVVNQCEKSQHTPTMPVEVAERLIKQSIKWVLFVGPSLLNLRDELDNLRDKGLSQGRFKSSLNEALTSFNQSDAARDLSAPVVSKNKKGIPGISLRTVVECFVPTAAWIVIASFTARRHKELMSLLVNSISGSPESGFWIETYIAKTMRRYDRTPCPVIVSKAIELLIRWGRHSPQSEEKLFVQAKHDNSKIKIFRVNLHLDSFAEFVSALGYLHQTKFLIWHSAPHQFRRVFCIIYVWRYDSPSLEALSYHLRHANLQQTMQYVRDAELSRLMSEETQRLTHHKLMSIAYGVKPAGVLGHRLLKTIERLRATTDISDHKGLERKINEWVVHRGLSLKATPWGYCGVRAVAPEIRRSACQSPGREITKLEEDGTPDASASNEETCSTCWFHLTDVSRLPYWRQQIQLLSDAISAPNCSDLMRHALQLRLNKLQKFVNSSFPLETK